MKDFTRLFDLFSYQLLKYPQPNAICSVDNGKIVSYSTLRCIELSDQLSSGLINLGLQKGDTVAILSTFNCPEWILTDFAIQQAGGIVVPVHATASADECLYIFNHAQIKWCFVNNRELYRKIQTIKPSLPNLKEVYCFADLNESPNWKDLLTDNDSIQSTLENIKLSILPQDIATIIYTSGTTGEPKGVMLSHHNIVSNIKSILPIIPVSHADKVLSFLPLSHVFERTAVYNYIAVGAVIHFSMITQVEKNLKVVRPYYFSAVPRVLERMYEEIEKRAERVKGIKRKIFDWALLIAEQYPFNGKMDWKYAIRLYIARLFVFNNLKKAVGGKVKGVVLGAAALQPSLARIFTAAGIPVREGYGLTETSPVLSFNRFEPGGSLLGTVGIPIPGVEIRIADSDGEILAKGPNIMQGYFKQPELSQQCFTADGWFHTGDLGAWVNGKFLKITGRKKELFKVSSGKYVAPQPIENRLRESAFIEQVVIIGDGKRFITALIVPALGVLESYCQAHHIETDLTDIANWLSQPEVIKKYNELIDNYNLNFANEHPIKKYLLLSQPFTTENGLLTPTLKVKRESVIRQYHREIEEIYS